jgi:hypothetical protein
MAGEPLLYVASEDIDADLRKAESLGGTTVVPKTEIPQVGWFGVFKDPTGGSPAWYAGPVIPTIGHDREPMAVRNPVKCALCGCGC